MTIELGTRARIFFAAACGIFLGGVPAAVVNFFPRRPDEVVRLVAVGGCVLGGIVAALAESASAIVEAIKKGPRSRGHSREEHQEPSATKYAG